MPRQKSRHFAVDILKRIFLNENSRSFIKKKMSLKFVPKRPINNIPALVQLTHCGLVDLQKRAILTP